mgnify:CR=1 FL=1
MPAFRLTQLRHFTTVAETGSLGVAARLLHISQPALTRSIQRLEKDSEGPLFERGPRGVSLTPRGEALLPYVRAMLLEADRATEVMGTPQAARLTRIAFGVSPNFARHVSPDIIADFVGDFPDASILTRAGTAEQLIAMVAAAAIDVGVTLAWGTTVQLALAKNPDLAHEHLAEVTASVFAPAGHPLASSEELPLELAAEQRWAVPYGVSLSYVFRNVFVTHDLEPPAQVINSSSIEHMLAMSQRLGLLLIVPRHVAAEDVRRGALIPLVCPPLALGYDVELITRRRGTRTAGLSRFCDLVRRRFAEADLR